MRQRIIGVLILGAFLSSCASIEPKENAILWGAGVGGASGAIGGSLLSPNDESRGLNALVFGLTGAIVGAFIGFFSSSGDTPKAPPPDLESREKQSQNYAPTNYTIPINGTVPEFLKSRVSPAVIEEYVEQDSVGEDGALHAPHKVYRIKHQAELIAHPNQVLNAPKTEGVTQ